MKPFCVSLMHYLINIRFPALGKVSYSKSLILERTKRVLSMVIELAFRHGNFIWHATSSKHYLREQQGCWNMALCMPILYWRFLKSYSTKSNFYISWIQRSLWENIPLSQYIKWHIRHVHVSIFHVCAIEVAATFMLPHFIKTFARKFFLEIFLMSFFSESHHYHIPFDDHFWNIRVCTSVYQ